LRLTEYSMRNSFIAVLFIAIVALLILVDEKGIVDLSSVNLSNSTIDPNVTLEYRSLSDLPATPIFSVPTAMPIVMSTQVVQPTYTPYPTYTPPATATPQPTYALIPTVVIRERYVTPEEKRSDMMFMRGVFVFALVVAIGAAYLWYVQWTGERRREHEYEMKRLEIEHSIVRTEELRAQSTVQASMPRPINVNTARSHIQRDEAPQPDQQTARSTEPIVVTRQGYEIAMRRVNEFVVEALRPNGVGLVVSRWKTDRHWDQAIVELMLDYLSDLELITPRSNGRACSWLNESIRPADVLRIISEDQERMISEDSFEE
jgi:hypothetical protein